MGIKERLANAFNTFDTDGSGTLSKDEIKAILTRPGTGSTMSDEDAEAFIGMFDSNGDGVLNLQEFLGSWLAIGDDVEDESGDMSHVASASVP